MAATRIAAGAVGRAWVVGGRFVWEGRSRSAGVGSIGGRREGWRRLGEGRIVAVARSLGGGRIAVVGLGRLLEELFER